MRRVGMARAAVWIALASAAATGLADCTDFGGDTGMLGDNSDAATPEGSSSGFPGGPLWDVTLPAQGGDGSAGADASNDSGNDGSSGAVDTGSVHPPGGDTGSSDEAGLDSGDDGGDAEAGEGGAGDAGADAGTPDAGALETGAVETGAADAGGPDAGDAGGADGSVADADAGVGESGVDAGGSDSLSPDSSGDSGTDTGAAHGCDPTDPLATTLTCFASRDKPTSPAGMGCTACATANGCFDPASMNGTCEMLSGSLTHLTAALPDGKTCGAVLGSEPVSESHVCMQTLQLIFSSGCAATAQLTTCVCGTTDPTQCQAGAVTPNGPAYDEYACDYNTTSAATIFTDFIVTTFGAGMANAIAQCAGAFSCDCF